MPLWTKPSRICVILMLGVCLQRQVPLAEAEHQLVDSKAEGNTLSLPEILSYERSNRVKRGFGHTGGGYGGGDGGYGGGGHGYGGAAAIAQQAANQAKAAQHAQGPAAYQAAQQARAILAAQAASAAHQAQAVTDAKKSQVSKISQAANAAQHAAYAEAAQSAKAQRSLQAAEIVKQNAIQASHYGGYGADDQIYAAQHAVDEARNVAAWQAQMAHQAQENAWALAQKQQQALHDLSLAQIAANKASWAAAAARANVGSYGHGHG